MCSFVMMILRRDARSLLDRRQSLPAPPALTGVGSREMDDALAAFSTSHGGCQMTRPTRTAIMFVVLALVALALPAGGPAQQKPLHPVTLILDFVPTGEYVPHYTALEKGWYKAHGLDVKIVRGNG